MTYYSTGKKSIEGLTANDIEKMYEQGYVLTRLPEMNQTRSLRIDLSKFGLSSENRRILRKTESLSHFLFELPLKENSTNWQIFAMCKKFYGEKFKDVEFSTNKVREMLVLNDAEKSRFNGLFVYYENNTMPNDADPSDADHSKTLGYCIVYKTENILHYCYPFYNLDSNVANIGMGMMLNAIQMAKNAGLKYVYLGSFTRPTDIYKLQFKGLEWWDGTAWSQDLETLKKTI